MTVLKATVGGKGVEIWFAPSFSIKTDSKELEVMLRSVEFETFDPFQLRFRKVKATKSLIDAYLVLFHYSQVVPEVGVVFKQTPELPNSFDEGTERNPVLH